MKNTIIIITFFYTTILIAQSHRKFAVYSGIGVAHIFENLDSFEGEINVVYSQKYTFHVKCIFNETLHERYITNASTEYRVLVEDIPHHLSIYQIQFGRLIPFGKKEIYRLNLKAGVQYNRYKWPINITYHPASGCSWLYCSEPAYTYYNKYKTTDGYRFTVNPSLEITFNKYIGISLAPYYSFNSKGNKFGGHITLLIGVLK